MNVLVIAPHPDDEALGCGGALIHHSDRGDDIHVVFLTSGELGIPGRPAAQARRIREGEAARSAKILGVGQLTFLRRGDWQLSETIAETAEALAPILAESAASIVYLPHQDDSHPDHRTTERIAALALQTSSLDMPARLYEVWSPLVDWTEAEDVADVMDRKLRAIRCYRSQLVHYRFDDAIRGLNQYRGVMTARTSFAEVFARRSNLHVTDKAATP